MSKQEIWHKSDINIQEIQAFSKDTMMETLDINYTEITHNSLSASMPVDKRTVQPLRKLHGGASCVLAETLGSVASNMVVNQKEFFAVGQHISTHHLKAANEGSVVIGKATPIHLGTRTHLWEILIHDENNNLISTTKLTMAIIKKNNV